MSFLPRSFALYGDSPRLNRGNRTPGPGSDLTTRYPYVLFRAGGLFGLRTRRKVELDFPFLVQDEARAKRFAGTGPKAGDDLLRLPLLEELARDLGGQRATRDALPDDEAAAGLLPALPARAAVGLRVLLDDLAGLGAAARAGPELDALRA